MVFVDFLSDWDVLFVPFNPFPFLVTRQQHDCFLVGVKDEEDSDVFEFAFTYEFFEVFVFTIYDFPDVWPAPIGPHFTEILDESHGLFVLTLTKALQPVFDWV